MPKIKRGRGPYFAQVPYDLQDDPRADAQTIATYAALQRSADFGSDAGSTISDAKGAKRAGLSERTFRDRRERLKGMGWIDWIERVGRTNEYVIHRSLTPAGAADLPRQETPTPSATDADPPRQEPPTTNNQLPRTSTERSLTRQDYLPFEDAYLQKFDGTVPYARIRKAMRLLILRHGSEKTLAYWKTYLQQAEGQYMSPERFGQTFNQWGPKKEIGWAGF